MPHALERLLLVALEGIEARAERRVTTGERAPGDRQNLRRVGDHEHAVGGSRAQTRRYSGGVRLRIDWSARGWHRRRQRAKLRSSRPRAAGRLS